MTSPGEGCVPPPMRPTSDTVWCGERNGRWRSSEPPGGRRPAIEWIFVASSASSSDIGGRIDGMQRASIDLPVPGGPTMSRLWPPATATSTARLAISCPLTSTKSGWSPERASASAPSSGRAGAVRPASAPERTSAAWRRLWTGQTRRPLTTAASAALSTGTRKSVTPCARRLTASGRTPRTERTSPRSESSPASAVVRGSSGRSAGAGGSPGRGRREAPSSRTSPDASRIAIAMGRSSSVPSLWTSAGARFTVTRPS